MLWLLRVLLELGSERLPGVLQDSDVQAELGLSSAELAEASPDTLQRWLRRCLQHLEQQELELDALTLNVEWLAERLGMSGAQRKILAFATAVEVSEPLSVALKGLACRSTGRAFRLLACVLQEPLELIRASLCPESPLLRSGMVQFRPEGDGYSPWIRVRDSVDDMLTAHYDGPAQLLATLCPRAPEAELDLGAFAHLSSELELLLSLLQGAGVERARGINVLLHGPPGTGKTQLVRSVARALRLPLHYVPDGDCHGRPLEGKQRLKALRTIESLLGTETPALIVFDELEDAFPWTVEAGWLREDSASDKAHTQRLLEQNAVPCIWVGNRIDQLDPACLRRFSLVLELPPPPLGARQTLLARYAADLAIPAHLTTRLAEDSALTPAQAARAARVTRLVQRARSQGPSGADVQGAGAVLPLSDAQVFERALRGERRAEVLLEVAAGLEYDPLLVQASVPLERLVRGLEQRCEGSVCLHGPPGTGKTAFARELARRLQRPFTRRSAGDLLDKYVGGTERAIAEMFEEATRSGSVLLLDEAEGLLRDRGHAQRSFEITQVNELLVRMEAFRGIFLCATNSFEALDAASLRRFDLRVELGPLDARQSLILLERIARKLGLALESQSSPARERLARLTELTPGDFASVLRGRLLMGEASIEALVCDLERAHAEKRAERRIGFRAG